MSAHDPSLVDLAAWISTYRQDECEHYAEAPLTSPRCCSPCLRDRLLAGPLAPLVAKAAERDRMNELGQAMTAGLGRAAAERDEAIAERDEAVAAAWDEGWAARAEFTDRRDVPLDWPDLNPYRAALDPGDAHA